MKIILTESQAQLFEQYSRSSYRDGFGILNSLEYDYLEKKLGQKSRIKLAGNTYLERVSQYEIGILFHRTHIITVDVTDTITLDCNGWITSQITRERMNNLLSLVGYRVWSTGGVVFISKRYGDDTTYKYEDNIEILSNGELILP